MGNKLRESLLDMIRSALTGFDSMVASAEGVLTGGLDAWDSVLQLADILKPFCYIVIAYCFYIEVIQVFIKVDAIRWENALKLATKMVLAKVCIDVAPVFLQACYLQSAIWVSSASRVNLGGISSLGSLVNGEMETLVGQVSGLGSILGLFASLIIVIIAIKICGLLVQVIAYGRMFEMYVYLAVSPLPCAFFPLGDGSGGGFSRTTMRFLKSFVAVCLHGVMMIICMRLFGIIIGNAFTNLMAEALTSGQGASVVVSELCYTMLLGAIVLVMSIAKCGSWAKTVIDAA